MMSSGVEQKRTLLDAARRLYALGGVRAYYRGLTVRFTFFVTLFHKSNDRTGRPRGRLPVSSM